MPKAGDKAKKVKNTAKPSLEDALSELVNVTQAMPTYEHFAAYSREVQGETSHRGAAILLAATVENTLDVAIEQAMQLKASRKREMFRPGGAFGEFGNKIVVGHALKIYGKETRNSLDLIRHIRNAFAHAKTPISFETPQVLAVCTWLKIPSVIYTPTEDWTIPEQIGLIGKERFQVVCNSVAHNLIWWYVGAVMKIENTAMTTPIPAGYEIVAIRKPLP